MARRIQQLLVVGAGQMGNGIAQVAAAAGLDVILNDISLAYAQKGLRNIEHNLSRLVAKGKLADVEKQAILSRIALSEDFEDGAQVDMAIEAATENLDIKLDIFRRLDEVVRPEAILATNTSSLPITEIAAVTGRPELVIGMHFMNPVPVMQLIEVIRGLATSDEVYDTVMELSRSLGKHPVEVQDFPGFVSNRVLMPMINEAIYCVYEGVSKPEDVDAVMKMGMNHPMGPLQLADFIGLDTCLSIMEVLYEGFADSKYRPCPLLRKYVKAGWLGKKVGRGFYVYES
ncbi:3-hydroxybutyryl-CoA dehydrogenase [Alicyclobacillus fastidiosus]|uniref:3-hydroxybutyryl-CoA dehydrogenase n=1 Tax=Alicyclobacillus fastidiosus TaxID=392011 RepID=A0ABV5AFM1_9BACL|nr:3-hydroxybutyryl-CoA dehydrogenase [Alicyclobacillus fastidiosus]WEH09629.1 3-hydroxybutyryl-CoA dehydrogenase [Alicyclobacillus fastidiosus]